ncbi:hypothetical protein [Metallosphaera hakonensis]|uniref:Cation transporter n=1 Tax=Metallosphaera hakonensis JCM 8857 = DSM 7519 TaxID=1293036 RepID=A0A2U9ISD2_9CREN|nr:hypothetical protein [Metallosphaera hakonensis]AWR98915.1 hypothetical protein DFR87_03520 [Metallosphaera hakonensis JCM 8857 = DSM 7519]
MFLETVSGLGLVLDNYYVSLGIVASIVVLIMMDVIKVLKDAVLSLIGASCNCELSDRIRIVLEGFNIDVRKIYIRRVGSFYSVYVIVGIPSLTPLIEAYRIRKRIRRIVKTFDSVVMVDIKMVPKKIHENEVQRLSGTNEKIRAEYRVNRETKRS